MVIAQIGDLPPQVADALLPCDPIQICVVTPAPTLTSVNEPQMLKVTASPPDGDTVGLFGSLNVQLQSYSSILGWQPLYQHESFDAVALTASQATAADYYATGLVPGVKHRARVAWCRVSNGRRGCGCWSLWTTTIDPQPSSFAAGPVPLPAAPVVQEVGLPLAFARTTLPTETTPGPGDGWGPSSVWTAPRAQILERTISGGTAIFGRLLQSTTAKYKPPALGPISFAEAQFRPLCTTAPDPLPKANPPANTLCTAAAVNYRIDLETRFHLAMPDVCKPNDPNATKTYYYAAQIAYEPNFGEPVPDPSIRIFRAGPAKEPASGQSCESEHWLIGTDFVRLADLCSNSSYAKLIDGSQILGRVEVIQSEAEKPQVKVVLGWDCTTTTCNQICTITRDQNGVLLVDSAIPTLHPLQSAGQYGLTAHHFDLRFDITRFGSKKP